jgi:hypothetical protein
MIYWSLFKDLTLLIKCSRSAAWKCASMITVKHVLAWLLLMSSLASKMGPSATSQSWTESRSFLRMDIPSQEILGVLSRLYQWPADSEDPFQWSHWMAALATFIVSPMWELSVISMWTVFTLDPTRSLAAPVSRTMAIHCTIKERVVWLLQPLWTASSTWYTPLRCHEEKWKSFAQRSQTSDCLAQHAGW